tara:strand:- start:2539 stop:3045 length:507 start_codon:yes stop_codon:yes gene_type:complete
VRNLINFKDIKNEIFIRENFYSLIIILIIFLIDRYSKVQIINNFSDNAFYINNYINLDLIWNTGIGFGLLSFEASWVYNLISLTIGSVIILLFYYAIKANTSEKIICSSIIGGAIGNFYDRAIFNAVPDFIDLHYGNLHWFTFNIADIFITLGVFLLILISIFKKDEN